MSQASQLLYGQRLVERPKKFFQLGQAERELASGNPGPALGYLRQNATGLTTSQRLERLALSLLRDALGAKTTAPNAALRPSLSSPALTEKRFSDQAKQEKEELSQLLIRSQANDDHLAEQLALALINRKRTGPLAVALLDGLTLDKQFQLYCQSARRSQTAYYLRDNLSWRLLGLAEERARLLSKALMISTDYNRQIGEDGQALHLAERGRRSVCRTHVKLSYIKRGLWRDQPQRRCPSCHKLAKTLLLPGQDDPHLYTILDPGSYRNSIKEIEKMLDQLADRFTEGQSLTAVSEECNRRLEDYQLILSWHHRERLGEAFATRFNNVNNNIRAHYINKLLDRGEGAYALYLSDSPVANNSHWLRGDEVADWIEGLGRRDSIAEIEAALENKLQGWMRSKISNPS